MPSYPNQFLKIVGIITISCLYAVIIAVIGFLFQTPVAITAIILLSLNPLRYIRQQGWLKYHDDSWLFGALALILLVIGGNNSADLLWMICGVVILWIALARRTMPPNPLNPDRTVESIPHHLRKIPLILGIISLFCVAEISGQLFNLFPREQIATHIQFILLCVGVMLITWGVIGNASIFNQVWDWREIALLTTILLFGFFVRIYHLQIAQRFLIDEILFIKPIVTTWDYPNIPLLAPFSNIASFTFLYPYLQSWSVDLIGTNLGGIRFVSAIFGTFGIIPLYLLSRVLFERQVAVMSAVMLATLPIHIQFSRIGINNIADPLFGTFALYFIALATRHPERNLPYLGLAGICTGLTQYWYDGGRFVFLGLTGLWVVAFTLQRGYHTLRAHEAKLFKQTLNGLLLFIISTGLIAFPVYYALFGLEKPLSTRFERVGISTGVYQDQAHLSRHIEAGLPIIYDFHFSQPESDYYYAGDDPIMPRHTIPFFIGGFCIGLAYLFSPKLIKRQTGLLIVGWLMLTWIGNLLLETPDISARYAVEFSLIALLIALGIDTFATLILRRRLLIIGAGVMITLIFGAIQVEHYFGDYMAQFNFQARHEQAGRNRDVDDMLLRAVDFPDSTVIYVLDETPFPSSDLDILLRFYRGARADWRYTVYVMPPYDAIQQTIYLERLARDTEYLFFVSIVKPEGMDTLILELFPDLLGPFYTDYSPSMSAQYAMYILPAQD